MLNLNIYVEGPRDERFFIKVIKPLLRANYRVRVSPHCEDPDCLISDFASVIKARGHLAVLVVDRDSHNHVCRHACKTYWLTKYPAFDETDVRIAEEMIESWYLAGAPAETWRELKIDERTDTNTLNKVAFLALIPTGMGEKEFRSRLLKSYSVELAKSRNVSFARFCSKYHA